MILSIINCRILVYLIFGDTFTSGRFIMRFKSSILPYFLVTLFIAGTVTHGFAADVSVTTMELITRGSMDGDNFVLDTFGDIDVEIAGGYKLGGALTLGITNGTMGMSNTDLSTADSAETYLSDSALLYLKSARVSVREAFNLPLTISYFTGETETFANGDIFPSYYGSGQVASLFRGYFYFPDTVVYDGLYSVDGTGIQIDTDFGRNWTRLSLYTYQDNNYGQGHYSSDLRWNANGDNFKIDTFLGGSYPYGDYGLYRAGVLIDLIANEKGEFFAQVGIPRFSPGEDAIDIGMFYFLFEPRIHFGVGSLIFTFFSHPKYYKEYMETETGETGDLHTNINLLFGKPEETPLAGGLETTMLYSDDTDLSVTVSPYMSFITQGAVWNLKLNYLATETSSISDMFSAFIGVRAEF